MGWNRRRIVACATSLLGASSLLGCKDNSANELVGELGNGTFTYLCEVDSDAQCDVGEDTSDLALTHIVLRGRFGIGYSKTIQGFRPASDLRIKYDDATQLWEGTEAGWVAVIAVAAGQGDDFAHFRIVEPAGLVISRRETSGSFEGSLGGLSVDLSVQGTITLRVAPVDDQDEVLAGGLTCEWWSNNPDVADVVGDETDNVVEVTAHQAGTAIINVHLGDLTAQTTVEVGG
ncbi:MAG: hypothetical protein JRI68_02390 [Deltaproteobacteria bacterium]|nr:hypothetical protein [Deltaproteobacteria bacterium]